ncbi:MAG TPA: tRNA dihydrouridine synthase DusB [Candidatus Hydrogenedentes bacterium]|mgnify:CR=1 FL=1|nr:tRNA dihydrouridine synthase DusB [Candidatus Hydrogenedentota bacterium]HOL76387.1 tRNA dihydrouridine synthase DusB [Candidatus Hydrogenedentota bacterium]HPO85425.1 tRNA dihydrouridine synthase DusB [Candidatus Hydrogenedentota bacterium]
MRIGNLELKKPLALAPMENVTDRAFRLICKELGADLVYTEFASSEALIRDAQPTLAKIHILEEERPIGIQIFGSLETSMERAAAIAESMAPDFIDINCGCWVRKVALREAGAGLLRDLHRFEQIVRAVIRGTRLPVTVKTRLGWDEQSIVILDVARMLEQCGVQALTVHCRTREQAHKGKADWSWLEKLKKTVTIPIIGNGDLMTPQDVAKMFETGCDGAMIGRGALQNPWLFRETKHYLTTGTLPPSPSIEERIEVCLRHLGLSIDRRGEAKALVEFRKYYAGYLRELPRAARVRAELMQCTRFDQVQTILYKYKEELITRLSSSRIEHVGTT